MSERHEAHLAEVLGGRMTRGSGSHWRDQMDGKTSRDEHYYAFAWDGKSTLASSVGVSMAMWEKAVEQAGMHTPLLPLRFYGDARLTTVLADLAVVELSVLADLIEDANAYRRMKARDD